MVFLQGAARSTSPSRACFRLVEAGLAELCLSPAIVAEVKEVMARPALQRKFPDLTSVTMALLLKEVAEKTIEVVAVPSIFSYPRDPKDEPYINLAIATGAAFLVSRDNDLLDLMNNPDFRRQFPNLTILDPVAFLRTLQPSEP
jgi:putative PIN family toxin of toxin-antitoxin system